MFLDNPIFPHTNPDHIILGPPLLEIGKLNANQGAPAIQVILQPNIKPDRSIWIVKSRPQFLPLDVPWIWAMSSTANFSSDHRANLLVLHACFAAAVAELSWAVGTSGSATYSLFPFFGTGV